MMSNPNSSSASNNPWVLSATDKDSSQSKVNPGDIHQFEDHFVLQTSTAVVVDSKSNETSVESKPFQKLEDSEEYLETLNRKLNKLTNPKNPEKSLLKALSERRSDEARRYLVVTFYLTFCCSLIFTV
jgi:hypothetical protein